MPITKRSRDLLKIRSMSLRSAGASVRFDRPRGEVVMTWLAGIIPFRRAVLPLDEIAGAQVRKVERNSGDITYRVVLRRRRSAADLSFACISRDEAMNIMREISGFLEIRPDEAVSAAPPSREEPAPQAGKA